jgi:hypothetical protein
MMTLILKLNTDKKARPISKVVQVVEKPLAEAGAHGWLTIHLQTGTTITLSPEAVESIEAAAHKAKAAKAGN